MSPDFSSASDALGLGDKLQQQVAGDTDELRKRRVLEAQQRASGSLAVASLFGMGDKAGAGTQ